MKTLIKKKYGIFLLIFGLAIVLYLYVFIKTYTYLQFMLMFIIGISCILYMYYISKCKSCEKMIKQYENNCSYLLKKDNDLLNEYNKFLTESMVKIISALLFATSSLISFLYYHLEEKTTDTSSNIEIALIKVIEHPIFIYFGSLLVTYLISSFVLYAIAITINEKQIDKLKELINIKEANIPCN